MFLEYDEQAGQDSRPRWTMVFLVCLFENVEKKLQKFSETPIRFYRKENVGFVCFLSHRQTRHLRTHSGEADL